MTRQLGRWLLWRGGLEIEDSRPLRVPFAFPSRSPGADGDVGAPRLLYRGFLRFWVSITVQSARHTPCAGWWMPDGTWQVPATLARTGIGAPVLRTSRSPRRLNTPGQPHRKRSGIRRRSLGKATMSQRGVSTQSNRLSAASNICARGIVSSGCGQSPPQVLHDLCVTLFSLSLVALPPAKRYSYSH